VAEGGTTATGELVVMTEAGEIVASQTLRQQVIQVGKEGLKEAGKEELTEIGKNVFRVKQRTAEDVNNDFVNLRAGNEPPWQSGTKVDVIVTTKDTKYVRVINGNDPRGSWIMNESEIAGLSPSQIKDKFALPEMPNNIADVTVPQGTTIYSGTAAPVGGWGSGGGQQIYLPNRIDGSLYTNVRPIN
jgi:hypothetical protein